eukprot:snap_masked-scaffold_10-processed-gene-4.38-mRNA-1 protein AED:1.00 eAED:1.00 QI:0/0/0/0/1/1/3/0/74
MYIGENRLSIEEHHFRINYSPTLLLTLHLLPAPGIFEGGHEHSVTTPRGYHAQVVEAAKPVEAAEVSFRSAEPG